jgi:hypothetical protein
LLARVAARKNIDGPNVGALALSIRSYCGNDPKATQGSLTIFSARRQVGQRRRKLRPDIQPQIPVFQTLQKS